MAEVKQAIREKDVLTIDEAAQLLGLSRNHAYKAALRGDFHVIRMGKRVLVPAAPLRKMLCIEPEKSAA